MGFWDESLQGEGIDSIVVRGPFDALVHLPRPAGKACVREGFEVIYRQGCMPDSFIVGGVTYKAVRQDG